MSRCVFSSSARAVSTNVRRGLPAVLGEAVPIGLRSLIARPIVPVRRRKHLLIFPQSRQITIL